MNGMRCGTFRIRFFPICYGIALEGSVDTAPESSESLAGCAFDI